MTTESNATPKSPPKPLGFDLPVLASGGIDSPGNFALSWPAYLTDALQRSVLFLELLRPRGNEEVEMTSRPMATVLSYPVAASRQPTTRRIPP